MRKCPTPVFLISILISMFAFSAPLGADTGKFNSSLRLLTSLKQQPSGKFQWTPRTASALEGEKAVVTVEFAHVLSGNELTAYESSGVSFYYIDGQVARTGAIYPAKVPWARLDEMGGRREVLRMESHWRPALHPTLDVSGPEIQADSAWTFDDPLGLPLTGKGVRVADFDTGIDVFHPSFFFADGDTVDWVDDDQNSSFTPGVDGIDLDESGQLEPGEILRFTDGWIMDYAHVFMSGDRGNDDNAYQTYWDWLYLDLNDNGTREFGPAAGFTENDPTFGEPVYVALDDDQNGALDPGERVVALGTSKVYATLNTGHVERVRGFDLISSDDDTNGHGTAVCGILAGNTAGRHRFAGIAPDVEILAGNVFSDVPLSFLIPWARSRGADVMLYEFGSFIYEFLDGSSIDEQLVSAEHQSAVQVTPSGNLGRGGKHAIAVVPAGGSATFRIFAPLTYGVINSLWMTCLSGSSMDDLEFRLTTHLGTEVTLDGSEQYPDLYYVWSDFSTSPRNTHKLDIFVDKFLNAHAGGNWSIEVVNKDSTKTMEVISNVADDVTSWAGGAEFTNFVSDDKNVTMPATSDHSLVNGSYSTRGFTGYDGVGDGSVPPGEISAFSGRGKRINHVRLVDVCSPGNYDVYTARSHTDPAGYTVGSYRQFSGTSAAGPHVAAAAALVRQAFPDMYSGQIEFLVREGAVPDAFTGAVPNDTWGYGKLRILGAIRAAIGVQEIADGKRAPTLLLDQNYPNPFNPTTWIPFYLPADGRATLKIYNVRGQLVKVVRDKWYGKGPHSVVWDGTDQRGNHVSSGVYFSELIQGIDRQTRKMTLIR